MRVAIRGKSYDLVPVCPACGSPRLRGLSESTSRRLGVEPSSAGTIRCLGCRHLFDADGVKFGTENKVAARKTTRRKTTGRKTTKKTRRR